MGSAGDSSENYSVMGVGGRKWEKIMHYAFLFAFVTVVNMSSD